MQPLCLTRVYRRYEIFNMKKVILILLLIIVGIVIYFSLSSSVTNNLDTYIYDLPFKKGTSHKLVQGYGRGMFSHKNKAAWDFGMPEGTPVYAARGGVLYSFKDNSDEGGPFSKYDKKANYIIIRHDDGSFGCYWHLQKNGVVVKKGMVGKGKINWIQWQYRILIVLRPHLHFAVKRKLNYEKDSFVRTKFRTARGILLLGNGETYENPLSEK